MKKILFFFLASLLIHECSFSQGYTGLIGRWPLNGSAADVSGHGLNGVIHGATPATGSTGIANTAYHFNGTSDCITVPYNSLMNSMHNSICVKVRAHGFYSGTCQGNALVWRGREGTSSLAYFLEIFDNAWDNDCLTYSPTHEIFGGYIGGATSAGPVSACLYTPNTDTGLWYCVVQTYDGDTLKVYVDGVLKSRRFLHCTYSPGVDSLNFGKSGDGPPYDYFLKGDIDEVRLYNRALTATETVMFCDSMAMPPVTLCDTISLIDTIHACPGTAVVLNAAMSGTSVPDYIHWSPATGLSDTTIMGPMLTAGVSGMYYITTSTLLPGDLIVNGNFSAGNTGFTSAYTYVSGPMSLWPASVYAISTDPHNEHPGANSFHDHTTGTGNMMAMNGASSPIDVWCQTVSVVPNTYYDFSAWFSNWSADTVDGLPQIIFEVNGTPMTTTPFTFVPTPGLWTRFHHIWYSGSSTTASFCINDQVTVGFGNDFSIDDISLQPICYATDSVYVAVGTTGTIHRTFDTATCIPATHTLTVPGHTNYHWSTGSTANSISVSGWGTFWVSSDSACTNYMDTFRFHTTSAATVNLGPDTSICPGSIMLLTTAAGLGYSYTWSTGSHTNSTSATSANTYWVQVTDAIGCVNSDTIHISLVALAVNLGADTASCTGTSIILSPTGSYSSPSYLWSTSSAASTIAVSTPGDFWVRVTVAGCSAADTIHAAFFPPVYANLGNDTLICTLHGDVVLTSAQTESVYSTWSTGNSSDTIHVAASGHYWVEVNNHGCKTADSILITIVDSPYAVPNIKTDMCAGDTATVSILAQSGNIAHYTWGFDGAAFSVSPTDTAGPFIVKWTDTGTYMISLFVNTPEGCPGDTAYDIVTVHPMPDANIIDSNLVSCLNDSIVLRAAVIDPAYTYLWLPESYFDNPHATTVIGRVTYSADIVLTVATAYGCKAESFVSFNPDSCCMLKLPAGFTPNGDGLNDLFRPITKQNVVIKQFRVFNRWGNCVYESKADNAAWDGSYNGEKQDMNVFYYYIKYTCAGSERMQKGEVTLVR